MLEISFLGPHRTVTGPGVEAALQPSAVGLLAYLVLGRRRPQPRDVVATVFWEHLPVAEARRRLNTALWRLRRVIEPAGVPRGTYLLTGPAVGFNPDSDARVDVADFEAAVLRAEPSGDEVGRLEAAVRLYRGDLLEGMDGGWLVPERERLRELYLTALTRLVTCHREEGRPERALAHAHRLLDHDPLREDIHRAIMRLYAESDRRSAALRQYDRCRRLLAEELGVDPLPETTAVAASVARGTPVPPPVPGGDLLEELHQAQRELTRLSGVLQRAIDRIGGEGAETAETARR